MAHIAPCVHISFGPFLATGQALIDVKDGELALRVGDDQVKFNLY